MKTELINFQNLFESVPGLYLILSPDLNIIAVNDAYAKATMTKREEIVGRGIFDVFPENPDDKSADGVSNLMNSFNMVRRQKKAHTMPIQKYDIRKKDGTFEERYWSPVNTPVLNSEKEVDYIIHRVEDVTEFVKLNKEQDKKDKITKDLRQQVEKMEIEIFKRAEEVRLANKKLQEEIDVREKAETALRESQKIFSTVFFKSPSMNTIADANTGKYIDVNEKFADFCKIKKEEIIGKTSPEIDLTLDPDTRAAIIRSIKERGSIKDTVAEIKNRNGEICWVSISAHLINIDGKDCFVTAMIDVTERKANEELIKKMNVELEEKVKERTNTLQKSELALVNQNKQLQSQNRELEQFAYVASHDLQEPLRSLISFSNLLREEYRGKLDNEADKYLNFITTSSKRMQDLVKGLLDYSRIGKEKELVKVNTNTLLREVLSDLTVAIEESEARVIITDLPELNAYKVELRQLFQNLISNALKFKRRLTAPLISISCKKFEDHYLFSVEDNGIGIDDENKDKIFTIFKRLHNRNEYEGTGIGLSHCKKIVELHDGNIWVESNPELGSTFYFTISKL